jgi:adenosylmethionine-8-amino-7-oxononanoate aminotransferase
MYGDGYFYAVELVKDKATKETLDAAEVERVLRGYIAGATFEIGLYCRIDDRGDPVVQVAPPLICGQAEFDEMEQILRHVLSEAWTKL